MRISVKKVILCLILLTSFFKSEVASAQKKDVVAFIPFSKSGKLEKLAEERLYNLVTTAFINAQRFEILEKNNISVATDWQNYQKNAASINSSIAKQGFIKGAKIIIVGALSNVTATQDDKKNWSAYISADLKYVNVETGISDFALSISAESLIYPFPIPNPKSPEEAIDKALKSIVSKVEKWIKEKFPLERPVYKFELIENTKVVGKGKKERMDTTYSYAIIASGGDNVGIKSSFKKMYFVEKQCELDDDKITVCHYKGSSIVELKVGPVEPTVTNLFVDSKLRWQTLKDTWEKTPEKERSKKFLIVESIGK